MSTWEDESTDEFETGVFLREGEWAKMGEEQLSLDKKWEFYKTNVANLDKTLQINIAKLDTQKSKFIRKVASYKKTLQAVWKCCKISYKV